MACLVLFWEANYFPSVMGYGESFMRRFDLCGFTRMHDPDGVSYSSSEDVLANSFYQCYWNE